MTVVTDKASAARALLREASARFEDRLVLTTAIDLEGSVLAHMVAQAALPIRLVTLDTGLLFSQTYATWKQLETELGITIEAHEPALSLEAQAAAEGADLWRDRPNRCCEIRKVQPLQRLLRSVEAWITGIRREQTPERADAPFVGYDERFAVMKYNPLADWAQVEVKDYLRAYDVPYNPMFDNGYPSIGCAPCTRAVAEGEDPRAGRWGGFDKRECGLHFATEPDGTVRLKRTSA